jgi:hypothetical protein
LAHFPQQAGCLGKCPHWNRSVVGRHAAERVAGNERCPRTEVCRTARGDHTGRSSTNDDDLCRHTFTASFHLQKIGTARRRRAPSSKEPASVHEQVKCVGDTIAGRHRVFVTGVTVRRRMIGQT